jgi:aminocarboxymuconate-semialdehyde decarboxylase
MVDGKVFRKIDSRCWDSERRLEDMAADSIHTHVVSPMPELLSHWFPAADADALSQNINEETAQFCAAAPDRFVGIGMIPMQDSERAVRCLETVKSLGLRGIEIGTHINGVPLGHESLHDIYAAAENANLLIMIHPLHPAGLERIGGRPELAAVAAFPLETALAATSLLTSGVTERFPKLRFFLSHGGGALPWILPRLHHAWNLGPPLQGLFPRDPAEMARRFYYDTVLYDRDALTYLTNRVGESQIVIGSDYPFTIKQDRPAEFAEQATSLPLSTFDENAHRLLDGTPA